MNDFELFPGFKTPPNEGAPPKALHVTPLPDYREDFGDDSYDERDWCDRCSNMGIIDCLCGGDICCCSHNGEIDCPNCS